MTPQFRPLNQADLPAVLAIEQTAYSHPWGQSHFEDSMRAGYRLQGLWNSEQLLGYSVVMRGVDEAHLLNLTVAPNHQSQGHGQRLMRELCAWARQASLAWLWLEVRASNTQALRLYEHMGLQRVGLRKGYYPLNRVAQEDAVVMSAETATLADFQTGQVA